MPNVDDPVASADALAEHARALVRATAAFDRPSDGYWVLGSLLATHRRVEQVYVQVATAHLAHQAEASTDTGDPREGRRHAQDAAMALRRAVFHMDAIERELDDASQHLGQIRWPAPVGSPPTRAAHGRQAPAEALRDDGPSRRAASPSRSGGRDGPPVVDTLDDGLAALRADPGLSL